MSSAAFDPSGYAGFFTITTHHARIDEATGDLHCDLSNAPAAFWLNVATDGSTFAS